MLKSIGRYSEIMENFREKNQMLKQILDDMDNQVSKLHKYQMALEDAVEIKAKSVDELEENVEELKEVLNQTEVSSSYVNCF